MAVDDFRLEDFLSAVTDALQQGDATDIDHIAARYQLNGDDARSLVNVIRRLNQHLMPMRPSDRFVARLRADLTSSNNGLVQRVRNLPPRVQFAAGAITVAGLLYIAQRRFFGEDAPADGSDILPEQTAANH